MPNSLFLSYNVLEKEKGKENGPENYVKKVAKFPLLEDISLEIKSEFGSFGDMIPSGLKDGLNLVTTIQASGFGKISEGWMDLANFFDVPRWQKTFPVSFTTKLIFYVKNDAYADVYLPMAEIMSQSILSKDKTGKYTVPGISVANIGNFNSTAREKGKLSEDSKLISVEIPGIIYLPAAFLYRATPVYSKHNTKSAYPIWGELEIEIQGLFPATTDIFNFTSTANKEAKQKATNTKAASKNTTTNTPKK